MIYIVCNFSGGINYTKNLVMGVFVYAYAFFSYFTEKYESDGAVGSQEHPGYYRLEGLL